MCMPPGLECYKYNIKNDLQIFNISASIGFFSPEFETLANASYQFSFKASIVTFQRFEKTCGLWKVLAKISS